MALTAPVGTKPAAQRRMLWAGLAAPGMLWLLLLFVVPFYAMLATASGQVNQILGTAVPIWNPLDWSGTSFHAIFGQLSFLWPIIERTLIYVVAASLLSLLIAYPAAYFVTRFSGRRKGLFLALLIAPFWVSYMMRMLAWIDLLQLNGYLNRALTFLHLANSPVDWLGGRWFTVVLGLVYGYIPYLILVLYAGLDRIDPHLIEAGRDLGLGRARTFLRVTLPMSRQSIVTGMLITVLPMLGDYYTNQMLSGATSTSMIGNVIDGQLQTPALEAQGAALSLLLLAVLLVPMLWYVISTNRASAEAAL